MKTTQNFHNDLILHWLYEYTHTHIYTHMAPNSKKRSQYIPQESGFTIKVQTRQNFIPQIFKNQALLEY